MIVLLFIAICIVGIYVLVAVICYIVAVFQAPYLWFKGLFTMWLWPWLFLREGWDDVREDLQALTSFFSREKK